MEGEVHKELIEACKKGKPAAQNRLYGVFVRPMFNVCMRLLKNREEAEDVFQEAFTEVFRQIHTFRYEAGFAWWIKTIFVNRCINRLKQRNSQVVYLDEVPEAPQDEAEPYPELDVGVILKAMDELPEGYRVVLELYLFEGYSHGEIAEILDISESTSKTQYMRAKNRLKDIIRNRFKSSLAGEF